MSEISPGLRAHLDALAAKTVKSGANLWDVLNAAQLLFTEDIRRLQRAHALRSFQDELEARSMPQLIGPAYAEGRSTPKDMLRGVTELLDERVELARKGKA